MPGLECTPGHLTAQISRSVIVAISAHLPATQGTKHPMRDGSEGRPSHLIAIMISRQNSQFAGRLNRVNDEAISAQIEPHECEHPVPARAAPALMTAVSWRPDPA